MSNPVVPVGQTQLQAFQAKVLGKVKTINDNIKTITNPILSGSPEQPTSRLSFLVRNQDQNKTINVKESAINSIKKAVHFNFDTVGANVAKAMISANNAFFGDPNSGVIPFLTNKVVSLAALVARVAIGILLTGVEAAIGLTVAATAAAIVGTLLLAAAGTAIGTFPFWISGAIVYKLLSDKMAAQQQEIESLKKPQPLPLPATQPTTTIEIQPTP